MSPEQWVALIGSVTALLTALGGLFLQLRQIHKTVNQRYSDLVQRTVQLRDSLKAAGVEIPDDESAYPAGYRKPPET